MNKNELASFIAEFIMSKKEIVLEAIQNNDTNLIRDNAYEYLDNCTN